MFSSRGNLHKKALSYVIRSQERLHGAHIPYISSVTLSSALSSDVVPVRRTRQQNRNDNYILSPTLFRSGENRYGKALRYVIKIQLRVNEGHFPYLSSVTPLSGITFRRNTG